MTSVKHMPRQGRAASRTAAWKLTLLSLIALGLSGCLHDEQSTRVAGWVVPDPAQRHPIMVTQPPASLALRVPRGAHGLTPQQRAQLIAFADRYRASDTGNSKLVILAPSGGANEVATMQAVAEIRHLLREAGFDEASIIVEAFQDARGSQPPIRVTYLRFVAEAPQCGHWGSNLADDHLNVGIPNLGCATQANFAAMVANPADLLGPRTPTPRSGERRDQTWDKYIKGQSTVATKTTEEKVQVKGAE